MWAIGGILAGAIVLVGIFKCVVAPRMQARKRILARLRQI